MALLLSGVLIGSVLLLYVRAALRFSCSWILRIEGQLVYRLARPVGRQSSAVIGQRGRLLINPTPTPIYQQVLLYYGYSRCQEYESTRLDAEQDCKSNDWCHPIIFKDHVYRWVSKNHYRRAEEVNAGGLKHQNHFLNESHQPKYLVCRRAGNSTPSAEPS